MSLRKRFIAGAVCPECQSQDSLVLWRENRVEIVECVKCGHRMQESDKKLLKPQQIIGIFHPD